jgi:hypothetical protein
MEKIKYANLTELLLKVVKRYPGMYLGKNRISYLPNFILGYQFCSGISPNGLDFYFGDKGFLSWYTDKYNQSRKSTWCDYFLSETDDDESKALELYFKRLEEYYDWYNSVPNAN